MTACYERPRSRRGEVERVPLTNIRKTIARRLTEAWQIPVFQLQASADMTRVNALVARLRERDPDVRVTVTDVLTKVCAQALMRHREVNAEFTEDAILLHPSANVGLAVAAPQGLVVPVIRGAERLSLTEIAGVRADLVGRARENKLRAEDLEGGTFTISNLGMYAVESFTAVLNPPQAAIVAVGATEERVVPVGGETAVRPMVTLTAHLRPPRRRRRAGRGLPPDAEGEPRGPGARAVELSDGADGLVPRPQPRRGPPLLPRRCSASRSSPSTSRSAGRRCSAARWRSGSSEGEPSDDGVAHVDVADLKAEAERLREAGVEVGIVLELTGEMRLLDVYDPDGNRIQLAQELRRLMLRPVDQQDTRFLRDMLRHAYHWRIAQDPDLPVYRYVQNWGRPGDAGVIAFAGPNAYGAAWYRLFPASAPGFGFVDEETPELTIAVVPSHRGHGTGAELLEALLERARADGFSRDQPQRRAGPDRLLREARLPRAPPRGRNRDDGRRPLSTLSRNETREMSMDVDVAVLGGGPGGYTAAIRAAQLGAKVACIEKEPELGGTCLRVGCIPTKAWVQTAFALKEAEESFAKFGVSVGEAKLDFAASNAWKAGVVKQMTTGVAGLFKANGVEWVKGDGHASRTRTRSRSRAGRTSRSSRRSSRPARIRCARRSRGSTRRAASTRPACSRRSRCPSGSSSSAAASSAASSPRSSAASAPR